jgi:cytochrome P450
MSVSETVPAAATPTVRGLPLVGNALDMAKDPAQFFVECYREHGPVFRVRVLNQTRTVIAGPEAAIFLGSAEGRQCLRSKEFWQGMVDEYGASRTISGEDGASHKELREIMRRGYSAEAVRGRLNELVEITDAALERDWRPGELVPVVEAMQYLVTDQLGIMLTGSAPREYLQDIRTTVLHILNVLVTRQRPKILLKRPKYRQAKNRVFELGQQMIDNYQPDTAGDRNLVDDIMAAHQRDPQVMPASDLVLTLTGPYVAGLDTVANTVSAFVYAVLKHPEVLERIHAEVDDFFSSGRIEDDDVRKLPAVQGALMETMRLYPIAVVQMRTATRDFVFSDHRIKAGEMLFIGTSVPHFMAEYFPDPQRFDIDRYARPRSEHRQPGVYSPYGRGPHTCLGKGLADIQMILTMARLFHRLDLSLDPHGYVLKTKTAPTPGPAMDFKVRVDGYRH